MTYITERQRENRRRNNEKLMQEQLERELYDKALSKLVFDEENGFLVRKKELDKPASKRKPAGAKSSAAHRYISFESYGDRHNFPVGNLAFYYHTGVVPQIRVQHLDGVCDNQLEANLFYDRPLHPFLREWGYGDSISWSIKMPDGSGNGWHDKREDAEAALEESLKKYNLEQYGIGYDALTGEVFNEGEEGFDVE